VFPDGLPAWVRGQVPDLPRGEISGWAPDISRHDGMWHLYWSIGVFGTTEAVIGHAVSKSLDPGSSDYGWVDQGPIVASGPGSPTMAIDPEAVTDEDGRRWLAWGSFGQGIMLQPLDPATGKFAPGSRAVNLARRDPFFLGVEGADLVRHDDQWYLFVSFGFCCRGVESNYSIHVGRSPELTGPYVDAAGKPMTANGGTTVTGSYANVIGPGHGSIIDNGDDMLLAHHYYDRDDGGRSTLLLRPLIWGPDGWPLSPDAGFEVTEIDEDDAVGEWHLSGYPEEESARRSQEVKLTLQPGGKVEPMGTWSIAGGAVVIRDVVILGEPRGWWLLLDPDSGLAFGRDTRTATIRAMRGQ
jgi:arabinan endo-1,5-alpha-L-arabinosidase